MKMVGAQTFLEDIDKFDGIWRSIELRAAVGRKGDQWRLLGLGALLSLADTLQRETLFDGGDDLVILRDDKPFSELESLIEGLGGGLVALNHPRVAAPVAAEGFSRWRQTFVQPGAGGPYQTWPDPNSPFPYIEFASGGKTIGELVDEGALVDRIWKYGYSGGLPVLSRETLGFSIGYQWMSQIRIVAPVHATLEASVAHGKLHVRANCHTSFLNDSHLYLSLSFLKEGQSADQKERVEVEPGSVSEESGSLASWERDLAVPDGTTLVRAYLFHKRFGDPLDYAWVRVGHESNHLLSTIQALMAGQRVGTLLEQHLGIAGPGRPGNQFEAAVLNLFAVQGFVVLWTGHTLKVEGVDLVVSPPGNSDQIILVSVTTSNNIHNKARTILQAWNTLRSQKNQAMVKAVIITCVPRADILTVDSGTADSQGIALLTQEDLRQLWDTANSHRPEESRRTTLDRLGLRSGGPI